MPIALALYVLAIGTVSFGVSRRLRGTDDFLIGGRDLGLAQGVGLLGGIFLAGTAVGVVGEGYVLGWTGAALDLALGLGFAILLITVLGRLRADGYASVSALIRHHYGPGAGALAALLAGGAWVVLLAAFIAAAGRALAGLTEWSETASIIVTVGVLFLYAMPGGMRAVAATNLGQLVVLVGFLIAVGVVAAGRSQALPPLHVSPAFGYLLGVTLLSAPTTVVAPDVILGVASLRDDATARRTLGIVVASLIGGGLLLALLGERAASLLHVAEPDRVLPALFRLTLPSPVDDLGLVVLFGASLAGAVSELMVCTYVFSEELEARRRGLRPWGRDLRTARALMAAAGVLGGVLALFNPHVVDMVLMAFRIYVPAVVPQAIAGLLGARPSRWVLASMLAGPAVSLSLLAIAPATAAGPLEPVLWGSLAAVALLLVGARRAMTETYERKAPSSFG